MLHSLFTQASLALLAILPACGPDKQGNEPGSGATDSPEETTDSNEASPGDATTGAPTTGSSDVPTSATGSTQATDTSSESTSGEQPETTKASSESGSDSTDTGVAKSCEDRHTEEDCNVEDVFTNYEHCLWVRVVTWDAAAACPDLDAGVGTCIIQDFTDDCSSQPSCELDRIFSRHVAGDTYEVFAHPKPCGSPVDFNMCWSPELPVCKCFGCPDF